MNPDAAGQKQEQTKSKGDYEIGYGRPPVATRFRPGDVGNPKGRPKRGKPVGQIIHDAMMTPVRIDVNGKPKTMTAQEVIIHNLVRSAARGDTKAIHTLFALKARYQESAETTLMPSDLEPNDRKIIEEYLAKISDNTAPAARELPASAATANADETAAPERTPDQHTG
jgi:hypothetical protein